LLHDELLTLARALLGGSEDSVNQAHLRRAISTAYYALFQALIHAATTIIVATEGKTRISRAFDHRVMKNACKDWTAKPEGERRIGKEVRAVAEAFVALQEARHKADYDLSVMFTQTEAEVEVSRAEQAFLDLLTATDDPSFSDFMIDLLIRSIRQRG
jgi:uncharacterized protein (UPF0332 family)